jgi:predicted MFS family arabinose efflux permease
VSAPPYRRDAVTWGAFGALFGFGFLNAVLGPTLPFLRAELGLTYLTAALHQVAFAAGGGTAGLVAASGRSRLSRRTTVVAGLVGAGLAGLGIGFGPHVAVTLAASYVVSACATSALIALWAVLSDVHAGHRAVAMTEGEIAVSLAGVATPLLLGVLATTVLGWRSAFVAGAAVALAAAAGAWFAGMPAPPAHSAPEQDPPDQSEIRRRVPPTLVTIFAVVALEFVLSFWLASYLDDEVGFTPGRAAGTVAVLYAAHLLGRVVTSRLALRWPPGRLILVALLVVVLGTPPLLSTGAPWLVVLGIAVTGAGTGATFPLASALHVQASARGADGALGQTLTVAALAQIVGPLGAGALAQVADLRVGLLLVPGFAILAGLSLVLSSRRPAAARAARRDGRVSSS